MKILVAAALFVLCIVAAAALMRQPSKPALARGDVVLLAEISNATGDPAFDNVLTQALAARLKDSQFLNILADDRVREALRDMGRSPDERVTDSLAPGVCRRAAVKALLGGVVAPAGNHYVIELYAGNCATGQYLARQRLEVDAKEHILAKFDEVARNLASQLEK